MDKRFKWPLSHRSGCPNPQYYPSMRPKKNIGDYYYHTNRGYPRMHYGNKHNSGGGGHYYYRTPHGRPEPPEPPVAPPNASSDVMTLIMENKNMKSMVMLQLNLMQEHTDSIAAKEKEIEDQNEKITTLLGQNLELKEQNAILEETVRDLKQQLQRHIKRSTNADNDKDDDDTLPPPPNAKKLCHAETQTKVGTVTIQPTQYKPPYVQQLQLNMCMTKSKPQFLQYEETLQPLVVHEDDVELAYQLQDEEIHQPLLEQHEQKVEHLEQELHCDQENLQLHEQDLKLNEDEQELQLNELELELHQKEQQLQKQQKYNHIQPPQTREKVQVTSVTELPPTTVVKKSYFNVVDSKVRGEFNGGKKISTIILHRVNQESSLTSNHIAQTELKELVEEKNFRDASTTEENDESAVITEGGDASKCQIEMDPIEEELVAEEEVTEELVTEEVITEEVVTEEVVTEEVVAEEQDEEKAETPTFANVNNGHLDHDVYGETDLLEVTIPMTLDCEEHEVETVEEEVVEETDEIILRTEEEQSDMQLPMAPVELHHAICLTPGTGTPNQGEQAVPVQMWPETARSEPQVLPIVSAPKTTVAATELKEIDVSQTNHVAPSAHSTPTKQLKRKYLPDNDQIQQTDLMDEPNERYTKQKIRRISVVDNQVPEPVADHIKVDEAIQVALPAREVTFSETHVIESHVKLVQNESSAKQAALPKANSKSTAAAPAISTAHVSKKFKQSSEIMQQSSIVEAQLTQKTIANHQTPLSATNEQKKKQRLSGLLCSKPKQQAIVTGMAAKSINTATTVSAESSDIKTLHNKGQQPCEEQLLNDEEQIIKKLHKHIHKQFEQLPQVQLKRAPRPNKQTTSLIYPPEPTAKPDPITPAPTPSSTPTPTSGSSSPLASATVTATTKSIVEIKPTPIQAPLTPISSVSNSSSNSTTISTASSSSTSSASAATPVSKSRTVKNIKPLACYAKSESTSRFLNTSTLYTTRAWEDEDFHCDYEFFLEEADELLSESPQLEIPRWEIVTVTPSKEDTELESITDLDFEQRHDKCVRDEIDRKKRDARYYREQVRSEDLRKRHNQDEILIPLDPLPKSTFYPLPEDIESIQYVTEVPVQAFGCDIVNLESSSDFTLPWLEVANAQSAISIAKAQEAPVATLASKKLHTTDAEARHQEMNSTFVFLKKRKRQRR